MKILILTAEQWIAVNGMLFALFTRTRRIVDGLEGLKRDGWYHSGAPAAHKALAIDSISVRKCSRSSQRRGMPETP